MLESNGVELALLKRTHFLGKVLGVHERSAIQRLATRYDFRYIRSALQNMVVRTVAHELKFRKLKQKLNIWSYMFELTTRVEIIK